MTRIKLYEPKAHPMRVAGFMSGSGTNLVKIIEHQKSLSAKAGRAPFEVAVVFTDNPDSNAGAIGEKYGLPVVVNDIMAFYRSRGKADKKDLSLRPDFDRLTLQLLKEYAIDAVALAGYMSVVTGPLLEAFSGRIVNVHPADLSVRRGGKPVYTGDRAVALAIASGETTLRSTTHIVREKVDEGEILMLSDPLPVVLPQGMTSSDLRNPAEKTMLDQIAKEHQERLKEIGDWRIFPATLECMAMGRYSVAEGKAYLDDREAVLLHHR